MRITNFAVKSLSLILIAGCLLYYQSVASARAAAVAENEAKVAEVEAYNREIQKELEKGPFEDGVFEGEADGYGGPVRVRVTVKDGYMESIEATEHSKEDPAYYMLAEEVLARMIEAQSTEIDTVSGATFSSAGLIGAVRSAVEGH